MRRIHDCLITVIPLQDSYTYMLKVQVFLQRGADFLVHTGSLLSRNKETLRLQKPSWRRPISRGSSEHVTHWSRDWASWRLPCGFDLHSSFSQRQHSIKHWCCLPCSHTVEGTAVLWRLKKQWRNIYTECRKNEYSPWHFYWLCQFTNLEKVCDLNMMRREHCA